MTGLWKSRPAKFWRDPKGSPRKPPERPVPLLERPWKLPTYSGLTDPDPPKGQTWKTPKNAEKKEMKTEKPTFSSGPSGCWPARILWDSGGNPHATSTVWSLATEVLVACWKSSTPFARQQHGVFHRVTWRFSGYIEKWHLAISYDISHELHCIQYIH